MKKIDSLNQVAKFHETFRHPILDKPQIPDKKRSDLRVSLIAEELQELEQAIKENNLVEVADALCDIQYVLSGAVLEFGLGNKFVELFNEVQRSNMSKACISEEEAELTVAHYKKTKDVEAYYRKEGDKFLVYRKSDNKTLKSINYSPANLKGILDATN
ncbi:MAG: nucleoside triphosphate pyrophosphohydrolase family protein [Cyclobacteriaceae bacterium]